jgi:hypothetical protein
VVTREVMPIIWGAFLTLVTAWSLGKLFLRSLGASLYRLEEDLFAVLAGSACLSVMVFSLCSFHLARKGVFAALSVVCIAAAWSRGALRPAAEKLPRMSELWLLLFLLPFAVYTVLYFFNALAPEESPGGDAAWHLESVARWWHYRGFVRSTGSMSDNLPQGLEMLFLFAFSFGRHSAASLVHFAFLATLPWLMLCYGRRFGMVPPFVLGALLVYLSPIAGVAGTSAYTDLAVACVVFGLFYILQIWDESKNSRLLWLAGLFAGFGSALSYTAMLAVIFSLAFVSWRLVRSRRPALRATAILIAGAAISMAPWMAKNWLWIGNPFWFPNPNTQGWSAELPMLWSLSGTGVQGLFGPWLLLTPLALLALRRKHGRRLLLAAALFALPALVDHSTRLLLPFAVFVAPAMGMATPHTPGMLPLLLLLQSLVSWPDAVAAYAHPTSWRITRLRVAPALRRVPQDAYLRSKLTGYAMARTIEELVPENARVLTMWPVPQAYTTRRLWNHSESATGQLASQAILAGYQSLTHSPREIRFRLAEQVVRALRIVQTTSANGIWSVIEMRVYYAGVEIPRRSGWRVTARPNYLDARRAFDNSEVTAWSTSQAVKPGMYLEEDFDDAVRIDSVMLVSPLDWQGHTLRLDGLGIDGHWRALAVHPEIAIHLAPQGLRRAAIEELKSLGFDYIVTRFDAGPGPDMHRSASYWGITCLREVDGACVYRLD